MLAVRPSILIALPLSTIASSTKRETGTLSLKHLPMRISQMFSAFVAALLFLAFIDLLILIAAIAQIAIENDSGLWSPFWSVQARLLLSLIS